LSRPADLDQREPKKEGEREYCTQKTKKSISPKPDQVMKKKTVGRGLNVRKESPRCLTRGRKPNQEKGESILYPGGKENVGRASDRCKMMGGKKKRKGTAFFSVFRERKKERRKHVRAGPGGGGPHGGGGTPLSWKGKPARGFSVALLLEG